MVRGNIKDKFFKDMEKLGIALTFDDVRLKTSHSKVLPSQVSLKTRFSRNVPLKIPLVSAAMDTVTEHELAIELAKLGGIGIIHKNMTSEQQAYEVARVKNHLNGVTGLIENPVWVHEDNTIDEIMEMKRRKRYQFDSFPVLDDDKKLVGMLTNNDFLFCDDFSLKSKEIMAKNLVTAKVGTKVDEAYKIMKEMKKKTLPIVDENNNIKGLYSFKDIDAIRSKKSLMYNVDKKGNLRVGAAVGVEDDAINRIKLLVKGRVDVIVIDTAHGDSQGVIDTLKKIKRLFPVDVVVGNVSEPDSVKRLIEAGADGVKIGQGPGSICTTRIIAGIGCPQVTAIYRCSRIGEKYNIPICADGGLRFSGDITIALGAGANCVMVGSMLAGVMESPGEMVFKDSRQWKGYRGMGSLGAMQEHRGSRERYKQVDAEKLVPEGIEGLVPYKGLLRDVIFQYIGGLRSGMGYVGAATIDDLRKKADFIRISNAGREESHPHDVHITKEAPNYSAR